MSRTTATFSCFHKFYSICRKETLGEKKQINSAQFLHVLQLEETGRAFVIHLKKCTLNKSKRCFPAKPQEVTYTYR